VTTTRQQLSSLATSLNSSFPERREVIHGALCAVLSGQHILLLGPPGTAKSALTRAIAQAFGVTYFETLLTRFSVPEELFGPISLRALEQDRYERVTTGKLPEAHVAFIDELWKANSAILNSLLSLVNERRYHNGTQAMQCPLISLFGASNELPDGKELEALFDRFLFRFEIGYLHRASVARQVFLAPEPTPPAPLDPAVLATARQEVESVKITDETVDGLLSIREVCRENGVVASDRRWKQSLTAVKAAAYLADQATTSPEDLMLLVDALWREPKERTTLARLVGKIADPISSQANEILDAARDLAARTTRNGETKRDYVARAGGALEDFKAQSKKLDDLAKGAGPRATATIQMALAEIRLLHADLAREVAAGLNLRQA
jgi:MoxR-like ATPase